MSSHQTLESQVADGKYDAVVRLELITDVYDWNRGWKMAVNDRTRTDLEDSEAIRVAPIGTFNVGKTWLIKKLCGYGASGLVSASDAHTEGLSIKMSNLSNDGRDVCFLDTAGLNSPVTSVTALGRMLGTSKMDPMEAMDEMLQEMKRHENFIREVAFDFAQVYLLVVGQISHREQLELLQLIQLVERHATKKQVIVVHNLKNMWYHDFADTQDPTTGLAYRDAMAAVFNLRLAHHEISPQAYIDELSTTFGSQETAVSIRHLFLTREGNTPGERDGGCKNGWVLERIRDLIKSITPIKGNVLADIAAIASKSVKTMVRLPPGRNIVIRFSRSRTVLLAGEVSEEEMAEMKQANQQQPSTPELVAAQATLDRLRGESDNAPANDDLRKLLEIADTRVGEERVKAAALVPKKFWDADTLIRLDPLLNGTVTCHPVALATAATNGDRHAKFNVSRARTLVSGQAYWMVLVHITLPGLAAGELVKLRQKLIWSDEEEGLRNEPITPQSAETLKIRFKARVLPVAVRQIAALNQHGTPQQGKTLGGAIRVDGTTAPVVIEAGNRPFLTAEGTTQQAREALREDGSYELDVVVHTKVENCVWEVPPVLNYSRGILTVGICTEPSEDDVDLENDTVYPDIPEWLPHSNGTDEDLQE